MKFKMALGCLLSMVSTAAFAAPGVRVAQAGSSPASPVLASSKTPRNYLETTALSYERQSITVDTKQDNATTSVDVVRTDLNTYPADLSFTGHLGDKLVLRLEAFYKETTKSITVNNAVVASPVLKAAGSIGVGYLVNPNFELGGRILIRRHFTEIPTAAGNKKDEYTDGTYAFGPYMVFTLDLTPSMNLEIDGLAAYSTGGDEYKPADGTTVKKDRSGFVFSSGANAVIAASNDIDFLAGLGLGYQNETLKQGANETTTKVFTFGLNLATVRFKF